MSGSIFARRLSGFAVVVALGLSACGGGGSGSGGAPAGPGGPVAPEVRSIQGLITDPPIAGAQVRLLGGAGNALAAVARSDVAGTFSFASVPVAEIEGGAILRALGGSDALTGYSFSGIELSAVLDDDAAGPAVVSPLTSLVVAEIAASGSDRAAALAFVAARLGLTEAEVTADPASSPVTQRMALKLSRLAGAVRDAGDPMARIGAALADAGDFAGALALLQADDSLSVAVRNRLDVLKDELAAIDAIDAASSSELIDASNRVSWRYGVRRYARDALALSPEDETTASNLDALADALWTANGKRGVSSFGSEPLNLVRYALRAYGIAPADLAAADFIVPETLATDTQVPVLAALRVIDHRIALDPSETLGDDNAARIAYFYSSDLSPHYRAGQVLADVFDDTVLDPVYVRIAEELARIGRVEEAGVVVNTSIWQPTQRADAMRRIGNALAKRGESAAAEPWWRDALLAYDAAIDGKGLANLEIGDAQFYQLLRQWASDYGADELATQALTRVVGYLDLQAEAGTYTTAYGRVLTAVRNQARDATDAAVEAGLAPSAVADAQAALEMLMLFLDNTPPQSGAAPPAGAAAACENPHVHYLIKSLYLSETAGYYHSLGLIDEMWDTVEAFNANRALSACNSARTATYVDNMAPYYAEMDRIDEYLTLVDATVAWPAWHEDAVQAAQLYVAYGEARNGQVEEAIDRITAASADLDDRVNALSWGGTNRNIEGLVILLREGGYDEVAEQVLDVAWELSLSDAYLDAYATNATTGVQFGCAKLASGYYDFVSAEEGRSRLADCADRVIAYYDAGTPLNRLLTRVYIAAFGIYVGNPADEVTAMIDGAVAIVDGIEDVLERANRRRLLASYAIDIGDFGNAFDILDAARGDYSTHIASAATNAVIVSAINTNGLGLTSSYSLLTQGIGARAVRDGEISLERRELVAQARDRIRSLVYGDEGVVPVGLLDAVGTLAVSSQPTAYRGVVNALASARLYDDAESVARLSQHSLSDRQAMLQGVANAIVSEDDFGGAAPSVARRDLDGDGKPDFFEAAASSEAIGVTALVLDEDIDGDGIPDASDLTPFCASCAD